MMRVVTSKNAAAAMQYYLSGLSDGDFRVEGEAVQALWYGKGAELLGLSGKVKREHFEALCMNRHPLSGEQLTARMRADRRVGFDINFHPPKGVSILADVVRDEDVLNAMKASCDFAMRAIEEEVETRVRVDGQSGDRKTGNLVWAKFVHLTSRPVDGVPDPHVHTHCYVFNVTHDPVEDRWKALQLGNVVKHARLYESMFLSDLAGRMKALGYGITSDGKHWDVAGISPDIIRRFSRRTEQINERAKRDGIEDPEEKAKVGARTRERKSDTLRPEEVHREWEERLTEEELHNLRKLKGDERELTEEKDLREAVRYAIEKAFERSAVVRESGLVADVLRACPGQATRELAREELKRQGVVVRTVDGEELATTREVLEEERTLVELARNGRAKFFGMYTIPRFGLSDSEYAAVKAVLGSKDLVTLVGVHGDKTKILKNLAHPLELVGLEKVCGFSMARSDAQNELKGACTVTGTVSRLLVDEALQKEAKKGIWWVNDANRLSTKQAVDLLELAIKVAFIWNPREKGSMLRGDVVRTLRDHAHLASHTATSVGRKLGRQKDAVRDILGGHVESGLKQLEELGSLKRCDTREEAYAVAAGQLVSRTRGRKKAVIAAATRDEAESVSRVARATLVKRGRIQREREFKRFERAGLDTMDKTRLAKYEDGQVVCFTGKWRGFKFGEAWTIVGQTVAGERLDLKKGRKRASVSPRASEHFEVYNRLPIKIGVGDTIRITKAGRTRALIDLLLGTAIKKYSKPSRELKAGAFYKVVDFTLLGHMVLSNGYILRKDYGHFEHGYAVTAAKQTVQKTEHVIYVHTAASRDAGNEENLGLAVSRATKSVSVVTDGTPVKRSAESQTPTGRDVVQGTPPEPDFVHDLTSPLRGLARKFFGVKPPSREVERTLGG